MEGKARIVSAVYIMEEIWAHFLRGIRSQSMQCVDVRRARFAVPVELYLVAAGSGVVYRRLPGPRRIGRAFSVLFIIRGRDRPRHPNRHALLDSGGTASPGFAKFQASGGAQSGTRNVERVVVSK
jgi:hypothetical protein